MLGKLRKGWLAVAFSLLTALVLGFNAIALAEGEDSKPVAQARLTKVINAPDGTDASNDEFTFTFTATDYDGASAASDCPSIAPLVLKGVDMDSAAEPPSAVAGDTFAQSVSTATFTYILGMDNSADNKPYSGAPDRAALSFPRAGVYAYRVTETGSELSSGFDCVDSKASYVIRIYVVNSEDGPVPESIIAESETDDYGNGRTGKVDSTLPELSDTKDTIKNATEPAGENGLNVDGLTFGNSYIKGGSFVIEKVAEGDYADQTKEFTYHLTITDEQAQAGSAITYTITPGKGTMVTEDDGMLSDVGNSYHCFIFDEGQHTLEIEFTLKHGGKFTINGVWGTVADTPFLDQDPEGRDYRKKWADGLNADTAYTLVEEGATNYTAKAYAFDKENATAPTFEDAGADEAFLIGGPVDAAMGADLTLDSAAGQNGTHVYVVNKFNDDSISLTGIFIDNLPYIVMVAVPLAVFALMFARRRRANAAA